MNHESDATHGRRCCIRFTRRRPDDSADIVVEIRPSAQNRLDLEVASR